MLKIRNSLFETNSSSTHSMTMCSSDEYELWKKGKMIYIDGRLITLEEMENNRINDKYFDKDEYTTYEQFWEDMDIEYETFNQSYITKSGETVRAFGYYGHDG